MGILARFGPTHSTIARETPTDLTSSHQETTVSGARFRSKPKAPSALDDVRDQHRALLERMVAEIRRRHYHQIVVRDGKWQKDRVVPLPGRLEEPLQRQLRTVRTVHEQDLAQGYGEVFLPDALARKWLNAPKEWI